MTVRTPNAVLPVIIQRIDLPMNPHFSPFLAHLLMDGLSRRASARATLTDAAPVMEPAGMTGRADVLGRVHGDSIAWSAARAAEVRVETHRFDCSGR
jgi:hypothetical protein